MSGLQRRLLRLVPHACLFLHDSPRMVFSYADDLKLMAKSQLDLGVLFDAV